MSNGQTVYRAHALRGVRGELADGFPSVFSIALPTLERYLHVGYSINDAAALTLLALIAQTDDTNMIHRGGLALAWQCKAEAAVLEKRSPDEILAALPALDAAYQAQRLSPGRLCGPALAVARRPLCLGRRAAGSGRSMTKARGPHGPRAFSASYFRRKQSGNLCPLIGLRENPQSVMIR